MYIAMYKTESHCNLIPDPSFRPHNIKKKSAWSLAPDYLAEGGARPTI